MVRGRVIVFVANSWDYDPTSKHHLARIFSRHNDVVWVDYHGTRQPGVSLSDIASACRTMRRVVAGARRVAPSIARVTPMVIPPARFNGVRRLSQRMLAAQLRRAMRLVEGASDRPVQVWSFAPDVAHLAGQFGEECFVYYCVDEYTEFEGFDRKYIGAAEAETLRLADVVVTTSQSLWERKRRVRPDAVLVRHGVDYDHFASAWQKPLTVPADVAGVRRPVFGFFGLIHHWVDVELLAEVARLRGEYSFVLLGECKVNVSPLRALGNVHLLGRRPYAALPAYCAGFDAGLLLFRRNEMTRHVNPIKMLEYLAAGLPVISTPLPEAERFAGPIQFADTPQRFAEACDRALVAGKRTHRAQVSRLVSGETWHSRAEELSGIVIQRTREVCGSREARSFERTGPSRAALNRAVC